MSPLSVFPPVHEPIRHRKGHSARGREEVTQAPNMVTCQKEQEGNPGAPETDRGREPAAPSSTGAQVRGWGMPSKPTRAGAEEPGSPGSRHLQDLRASARSRQTRHTPPLLSWAPAWPPAG